MRIRITQLDGSLPNLAVKQKKIQAVFQPAADSPVFGAMTPVGLV